MESSTLLSKASIGVYIGVVLIGTIISIVSFAFLIPLDSVAATTGVSIILSVAYGLSILTLAVIMKFYAYNRDVLTWINTFMMFLVVLPATIGATAMCVTSVQNARNLVAGQASS
jgi:hypothetical protein